MKLSVLFAAATALCGTCSVLTSTTYADLILNTVGVEVVEDFDSFRGLGFSAIPTTTRLDSTTYRATGFSDGNGTFGGEFITGDFARGQDTGAVTQGGAYAFDLGSGDFGVGVQPTGDDFNPGTFTIRIANQTGGTIAGLAISADAYVFNDEGRSTRWTFAGSKDDTNYQTFFTLDSPEAADTTPVWDLETIGATIAIPGGLLDDAQAFVRITGVDLAGTGARDQFALGRFSVTAVPEPSSSCMLLLTFVAVVQRRRNSVA